MVTKTQPVVRIPATPEIEKARATLTRMQHVLLDNEAETRRLLQELNGASNSSHYERQLDAAAGKLLATSEVSEAPNITTDLNKALQAKWREKVVIQRAIATVEQQLGEARTKTVQDLAEKLGPSYRAILGRMKSALLELQSACLEEAAFARVLEDADLMGFFGYVERMYFPGAGHIGTHDNAPCAHIETWCNQLREYHPSV